MPLPFAPPPKESKVYDDLKNIKVSDVTAAQMSSLKGDVYAQGVDGAEDEMRRLRLLGNVSNSASDSGPIPGTQKIISVTRTTQGDSEWHRPAQGEVWALLAAAISEDDANYHNIYISNEAGDTVFVAQETSATRYDPFPNLPLYYTYENYLVYGIPTSPGGGNNTITGTTIRVR